MSPIPDDWSLLQKFVRQRDHQALDALIHRHLDLVYCTAKRRLGDAHLAEDVAQAVFLILVRKAHTLHRDVVLPGWFYKATLYASANVMKMESRRRYHERRAAQNEPAVTSESPPDWEQVSPLLDAAMDKLPVRDRDALLLRYVHDHTFTEIGMSMHLSEEAARKRITRALYKLRKYLDQSGATLSAAALSVTLSDNIIQAAPAAVAARIHSASAAPATFASAAIIAKGTLSMIFWTRLRLAAGIAALLPAAVAFPLLLPAASASSPLAPAKSASVTTNPATTPAGPKAAFMAMLAAIDALDAPAMREFCYAVTPEEKQFVQAWSESAVAERRLGKALVVRFGPDPRFTIFASGFRSMAPIENATETVTGDDATINIQPDNEPGMKFPMSRVDGKWKVPVQKMVTALFAAQGAQPGQVVPSLQQLADLKRSSISACLKTAAAVEAGRYPSADEALAGYQAAQADEAAPAPPSN